MRPGDRGVPKRMRRRAQMRACGEIPSLPEFAAKRRLGGLEMQLGNPYNVPQGGLT